jgi:hypothetical protein
MAKTSSSETELVSVIFIETKYHSLLYSSGNQLKFAEALILTFLVVK